MLSDKEKPPDSLTNATRQGYPYINRNSSLIKRHMGSQRIKRLRGTFLVSNIQFLGCSVGTIYASSVYRQLSDQAVLGKSTHEAAPGHIPDSLRIRFSFGWLVRPSEL